MHSILLTSIFVRATAAIFTLYMGVILLRWFAPQLELDLYSSRWRWMRQISDPLVNKVRRHLPVTGPFDLAPLAAVLLLWLAREVAIIIVFIAT